MLAVRRLLTPITVIFLAASAIAAGDPGPEPGDASEDAAPAPIDWTRYVQPLVGDDDETRAGYAAFVESLSNDALPGAENAAKQLVEVASRESAPVTDRARALHNLAVTQQLMGSYDSAIQNYIASISAVMGGLDNLSPELVLPLRGLASALLATGQPNEAFEALNRAQHVSNVNYGPHSFEQLPILDTELEYYLDNDAVKPALDVIERMDVLYTRQYERLDEGRLPMLYVKADAYARLRLQHEERAAWQDILSIMQSLYDENDSRLIEPHMHLAANLAHYLRTDGFRSVSTSFAEKHLKDALWIAEHSPEGDLETRIDCLLSLGDFYTLFDLKGRARRHYAEAWELLSSDAAWSDTRAREMESLVPIYMAGPDTRANFAPAGDDGAEPETYLDGELTIGFNVDERGRPRDLSVLASEPADFELMERRARNAVGDFIYRPRYVDGRPVTTVDRQYRVRFQYRESDYQESLRQSAGRRRSR